MVVRIFRTKYTCVLEYTVWVLVAAIDLLAIYSSEYGVVCRETWQRSVPWRHSAWPLYAAFIFRAVGRLIVVIDGLLWAAV